MATRDSKMIPIENSNTDLRTGSQQLKPLGHETITLRNFAVSLNPTTTLGIYFIYLWLDMTVFSNPTIITRSSLYFWEYSALNVSPDSFKLQLTNKEEVFKTLSNVGPEKTCGLDEIPCRMLEDGAEMLAESISQIVNMSLGSKLPEGSKAEKVRPIFKKVKNAEQKKYRPASLLPVMSKVIERVVHNQPIKHLEKYEIVFDYQSGFRSKHFVNTCLTHLSNQI